MTTFTVNLDNVTINIEGDSPEEIIQTLQQQSLSSLIYNNFYFSKTTEQRTGDGWTELSEMHDAFIINAFAARLAETVRTMYAYTGGVGNNLGTLYLIESLKNLAYNIEVSDVLPPDNELSFILNGLVNELDRRYSQPFDDTFDTNGTGMLSLQTDYSYSFNDDLL